MCRCYSPIVSSLTRVPGSNTSNFRGTLDVVDGTPLLFSATATQSRGVTFTISLNTSCALSFTMVSDVSWPMAAQPLELPPAVKKSWYKKLISAAQELCVAKKAACAGIAIAILISTLAVLYVVVKRFCCKKKEGGPEADVESQGQFNNPMHVSGRKK